MLVKANHSGPAATAGSTVKGGSPAHALPASVSSPLALSGHESLRGVGPLVGGGKGLDSAPRLTVGSHASNASLAGAALLSLALERPPASSPSSAHPPLSHPHHHIVQHHPPPVSTPNSLALHPVSLGGVTTVVGPVSSGGPGPGDGRMRMIRLPPGHTPALPQSPVRQSALLMSSASNLNRPRLPQSPVPLPQTPINLVPARPHARGGTFKTAPKLIMNSNTLAAMLPKTPTPGFYPPSTSQSGASVTGILPTNPVSLMPPSAFAGSGLAGTAPRSHLPQPPSNLQPPVRMPHLQPSHPSQHPPHLKTQSHPPPPSLHPTLQQPQRHLLQRVHRRHDLDKGLDMSDKHEVLTHNAKGRRTVGFPSHHQVQMTYSPRSARAPQATSIVGGKIMASRQLNPALQDHNYASRPPPTPPQSPTTLSGNADSPSSFNTFGIASDPNLSATHAMVVGKSPILPPTAALDLGVAANVSPSPLSGTALEQANTVSIEEAGVGPMAPLVAAAAAVQAAAAQAATKEERPTAPNAGVPHPLEKDVADEEDTHSGSQLSPRGGSEGEGEETETAPEGENEDDDDEDDDDEDEEAEEVVEGDALNESLNKTSKDQDDSITRCICDFLHDDGYMICCDKCLVWQHVVCMGLDRNNIPDEYLCEICKPRPVDRKRAKTLQARRKNEIFNNSSSSEEGGSRLSLGARSALKGLRAKSKVADKKPEIGAKVTKRKAKWTPGKGVLNPIPKADTRLVSANKSKKQYRKRKPIDKDSKKGSSGIRRLSGRRKSTSIVQPPLSILGQEDIPPEDDDNDEEDEEDLLEPELEANQHLRSWIDHYEEAVTNHYSPELRARLQGAKVTSDLRSSAIGGPVKCNVSLKGNGVKILTAYANMTANTPVIECRGKLMLKSQYRSPTKSKTHAHPDSPYVFSHKLGDSLEICLDGKTYGNDSRFCRRSPNPNAQLKHVLDRGSLHIFIVSTKPIEKNQEILLPEVEHSVTNHSPSAPLPSINADLREIKKPNGSLSINEGGQAPLSGGLTGNRKTLGVKPLNFSVAAGAAASPLLSTAGAPTASSRSHTGSSLAAPGISSIKKKVANAGASSTSAPSKKNQGPSKPTLRKTSQKVATKSPYVVHSDHSDEGLDSPSSQAEESNNLFNGKEMKEEQEESEKPLDELGHHRERRLSKGYDSQSSLSPSKGKPSPGKLGLPDNSGLIVGVNTINYDASSSLRNKAKSREERKMEMIMKAIEQMEKAEQRKKDLTVEEQRPLGPMKRRRSQSSKTQNNTDSALDASSADEAKSETRRVARKKARKSGSNTPQRRRSRLLSGGSQSALSETEGLSNNESTPNTAESPNGPFRFPKTKKMLMSDWQHESELAGGEDDDVSASYLKGSRSPPGIATHLLRATAPQSPNKSVCSAKKRWLRQAISEDQTEEDENNHHRRQQQQQQQQQQPQQQQQQQQARHQSLEHTSFVPIQNGGDGESPNETVNDYVTPLKKRRLENYKNDQESPNSEQEAPETMKVEEESVPEGEENPSQVLDHTDSKTPYGPSSLKKKLLNNLVLEAVLDKAMQDMLGSDTIVDHHASDEEGVKRRQEQQEQEEEEEEAEAEAEADVEEHEGENKHVTFKNERYFDHPAKDEPKDVPISRPEVTKLELNDESGNCAMEFSLPPCTSNARGESARKSFRQSAKVSVKCRSPSKKRRNSQPEEVHKSDPIKPPSPSDVFKSFFKPNVSLEALEAQIEAAKREREANLMETSTPPTSVSEIKAESPEPSSKSELSFKSELSSSLVVNSPEMKKSLPVINDPHSAPNEIKAELSEPNDDEVPMKQGHENESIAQSLVSELDATTPKPEAVPEAKVVEESPSNLFPSEEPIVSTPNSTPSVDTLEPKEPPPPPAPLPLPQLLQTALTKPKEKRRVSLADYKRRRKIEDNSPSPSAKVASSPLPMATTVAGKGTTLPIVAAGVGGSISCSSSGASLPYPSTVPLSIGQSESRLTSFGDPATLGELSRLKPGPELISGDPQEDGPGTPTLDEQSLNLNPPPTLNALPLFEKLEKLERAQKECKLKVQNALLPESIAPPPVLPVVSIPEPKRENLTERLKKEFGLMVDDESNTENEGDSTPTTEESFKNSSGVLSHDDHASMLHPGPHIPAVSRLPTNFPTNPTPYAGYPPGNPYPPPPPPLPSSLALPLPLSNVPHYPKPNTGILPVRPYPGGPPHPPPTTNNHHGSGGPPPPPPPLPYFDPRENQSPGMNVGYSSQSGAAPSSFTSYNPPHPPPPNGKEEPLGRSSRRGHPSSSSSESKVDASYGCKGYYSSTRDRRDRNRDYDSRDRDYRGSPGNERDYHHGHHHRGSGSHKSRYGSSSSSYNNRF
ncbi:uncharacterized protein LOC131890876 [Tigriopus californicus]|uniref:uncharacterized protein LOC131890876 n=1 Tax=Tigriopus californicus TaxID=6832 RepID=UPI0027DAB31F|nr:uncharacterized protein LOC131890876 [Tigriopus californicus]